MGKRLVGMLDLDDIEDVLDRAEALSGMSPEPRTDWPEHLPSLNSITATYRLVDEDSREPVEPRVPRVRQTHRVVTRELDGAQLQWQVVRQGWVEA